MDVIELDLWDDNLEPIRQFRQDYDFLSSFHPRLIPIHDDIYPTAEHLFQACKTFDTGQQQLIREASTPSMAKKLGRAAPLRYDWEQIKDEVMDNVVALKFPLDPFDVYSQQLLATGRKKLVEGNWWHDQYWGDCYCGRAACGKPGRNQLGITLMKRRAVLLS